MVNVQLLAVWPKKTWKRLEKWGGQACVLHSVAYAKSHLELVEGLQLWPE